MTFTHANITFGTVSPDGHWLAYVSDETGQPEVYVRSFPQLGAQRGISTKGGIWPRWARNSGERYFLEHGRLMAVKVRLGTELEVVGSPSVPFQPVEGIVDYDVAENGQFLVNFGRAGHSVARINVMVGWNAGLK